jgi:hypothetical protein
MIWAFGFEKDSANTKLGTAIFRGGDELPSDSFASLLDES